jgi:hypothetical protein
LGNREDIHEFGSVEDIVFQVFGAHELEHVFDIQEMIKEIKYVNLISYNTCHAERNEASLLLKTETLRSAQGDKM